MYTRFYGFSEKPFNVTPDPKFLFLTESHQKALEAMLYGVGERKGFVSISGEAGTGKTTILHHVLNTLDRNIKTVFISQTQVTPKQLLKEIVQKIGLPPRDQSKISLIRQLNEHLLSALSQEGNLAVLIDEAQNLSLEVMEELRMLSNLETANSKLIQMVFVGQPELETKLNSRELRQLKQRIAIRSQIRPLTAEESRQYIDHRLRLVGRSTGEVFNPEAAGLIVRHAEGIPRTINLLCDNSLLIGYRRKEKIIPAATVKEVLSDRGLAEEEKGTNITAAAGVVCLPEARVKKPYGKSLYLGVPAALVLILVFLGGMGHLSFFSERITLIFAKNEAVATFEKVAAEDPAPAEPRIPPPSQGVVDEKSGPGEAVLAEAAKPPFSSPAADAKKPKMRLTTVEREETLYAVLRREYGQANTMLLDYVLSANPEISHPHQVSPGTRIRIPVLSEDSLVQPSSRGDFRIHLATFTRKDFAEKFKAPDSLKGRALQIENWRGSSPETWYRVFAAGYPSREDALKTAMGLRKKGHLPLLPPGS